MDILKDIVNYKGQIPRTEKLWAKIAMLNPDFLRKYGIFRLYHSSLECVSSYAMYENFYTYSIVILPDNKGKKPRAKVYQVDKKYAEKHEIFSVMD